MGYDEFAMGRTLKQILYGAFYVCFAAGIGYIIFFVILFPPSCTDGIRNQGETGIDCGGPCYSCEIKTLGAPIVRNVVYFINSSNNTIDLGAEIRNPNGSWGIRGLEYQFILKDAAGFELGRVPGSTFILPAETRWIVRPGGGGEFPLIPLPLGGKVAKVEFVIAPAYPSEWQKLKPFAGDAAITSRNTKFRRVPPPHIGFAELYGEIENRTDFFLEEVEVVGVLFDKRGSVLAVGKTMARTLRPGEPRFFSIKWMTPFAGDVARHEASGHSNFLLDFNFLSKFGDSGL